MRLFGNGLVVGSNFPVWKGLLVGYYVLFCLVVSGKQLLAFQVVGYW
jgi:hypothetical protein